MTQSRPAELLRAAEMVVPLAQRYRIARQRGEPAQPVASPSAREPKALRPPVSASTQASLRAEPVVAALSQPDALRFAA
jgi:hypothetical protein